LPTLLREIQWSSFALVTLCFWVALWLTSRIGDESADRRSLRTMLSQLLGSTFIILCLTLAEKTRRIDSIAAATLLGVLFAVVPVTVAAARARSLDRTSSAVRRLGVFFVAIVAASAAVFVLSV
jgi:hypothetical protein